MAGLLASGKSSSEEESEGAPFKSAFGLSGDFSVEILGAFLNQFGSMYSSKPSLPPSRPNPLSRYPPKPHAASNMFVQFTQTTPALICAATCSATLMLSLQTH